MKLKFQKFILSMVLFLLVSVMACSNADFNNGIRYQQEGEYDKAITSYNNSIRKNHNLALSQKNLGDIYVSRNDYKKGFECYIASIEANHSLILGYVLKFISDSNKNLRQTAIDYLPKIKNEDARKNMLEKLALMLKSDKLYEKMDALDLIASLGCASEPILEDILNLLKDENPVVRQKILTLLPLLKDCIVKVDALSQIINALQTEENELVKFAAINCLGNFKYEARVALPLLFDIAQADNSYSNLALRSIDNIARSDREHVKELQKYLFSNKNNIRIKVLNILSNMQKKANDMVPFIIPLLRDGNTEIRELARNTLRKIDTTSIESIPDLIYLLNNKEYEIRLMALTELTDLGKDATSALPAIESLLKDSNENVRKYAEYAISEIKK